MTWIASARNNLKPNVPQFWRQRPKLWCHRKTSLEAFCAEMDCVSEAEMAVLSSKSTVNLAYDVTMLAEQCRIIN